jgi:hypothetical protein
MRSGGLEFWEGNGDGTFNPDNFVTALGGRTTFLLAADCNRDGKPDLAMNFSAGVVTLLNISQTGFIMSASGLSPVNFGPGDSARSTITVTPTWGFNGSVTLSCFTLPSGVACNFNPPSLVKGTSTLTMSSSLSTLPGTYFIDIIGVSGQLKQISLLQPIVSDFSISATSLSPASVLPGGSATSTISILGNFGFSGTVSLSCGSVTLNGSPAVTAPPTCSFNPTSVRFGSGTSTVTVNTAGSSAFSTPPVPRRSGPPTRYGCPSAAWL